MMRQTMIVTSIDVGLINLGIVSAYVSTKTFRISKIRHCELVNLTSLPKYCKREKCPFNKGKHNTVSHYLWHLFKKQKRLFDTSDVILVERQPSVGFTNVEQVIQFKYPEKVVLIHPRSMHKFFEIGQLDYEERKSATTKIAWKFLSNTKGFGKYARKHDMSDALCMILFHNSNMYKANALKMENNPFSRLAYNN